MWLRASIVVLLVACGGAQHPPGRADAGPESPPDDPPALPSQRALAADATFGDLVAAAVHEDEMRASDSDAGCLLRPRPDGYDLAADLSVAVRGLPPAATGLRARVAGSGGRARVLTRLGSYGTSSPLVAVALTTLAGAPTRTGLLVVLTRSGAHVLRTDASAGMREAPSLEEASSLVDAAARGSSDVVFVTADGDVPLSDVAGFLRGLDASLDGRVALAAVLPEDARAPEDAAPAIDVAPVCQGLPALPDDAPTGEVDPADLRAALSSSLVPAAQACVATSASGLGGLLRVAFRIGPDGHVIDACVTEDVTGDATLRACLLDAVRALALPRPSGGAVDVELPLRLELAQDPPHHQRALCE